MLGRYGKGMKVNIPAIFQDVNKNPVEMDNVSVNIQFFDNAHRDFQKILPETSMNKNAIGHYNYEFTVPPFAKNGNYIVHIQAKYPGSISNIAEATETFEVIDDNETIISNKVTEPEPQQEKTGSDFDINTFKFGQVKGKASLVKMDVSDVVVDVFNNPIKGVHVNVYDKAGFSPKSPNNIKIASTITDENGVWQLKLDQGDYVFSYRGLNLREMREFRKVQ